MEASAVISIPPSALPPPIDAARLDEATGGDAEFTAELMQAYLEDTALRVDALTKAVAQKAMTNIIAESHTIKGSSANVGASRMQALASRVEAAARRGDTTHLASDAAKLVVELARVRASV